MPDSDPAPPSRKRRIAFYPCCAEDIQSACQPLARFADTIIFRDIKYDIERFVKEAEKNPLNASLPEMLCIIGDARKGIDQLTEIDVLFIGWILQVKAVVASLSLATIICDDYSLIFHPVEV